ncbi:TPA: phage tail protein [Enterobacter roggenkampii]
MNRQIVYAGAIPLETDLLNTNKYAMLGIAKLASSLMGGNTYVHGLACTPSSPASMVVNVAAGQIYSLQNIDGTAYSSLPADTTHSILKQGYILDAQQFTLTAPSTSGYSINYLIQVTYSDVDGGSTVLPYYNASNPSVAWSGPNNSGTAQYTVRQGICTVSMKAGVAATTGTQITPTPDTGCTGLYVITVAQGATTVTAGNIATYANAPFLPQGGIVDGIQRNTLRYAADTGVANAYVVNINPGILTLSDGMEVNFKAGNANTASSTLNVCALGAFPVLNKFGQTLIAGEIASGSHVTVKWSSAASSWFILDSTNAIPTVPTASPGTSTTQSASTAFVASAITAATGRLINIQTPSVSGTYTPTAGTKFVIVKQQAAGGNGANVAATASGQVACGPGGSAGAYAEFKVNISDITNFNFTIGLHAASSSSATQGGSSSFCGVTCTGGRCQAYSTATSSFPTQFKGDDGGTVTNAGTTILTMIKEKRGAIAGSSLNTVIGNSLSGCGGDSEFYGGSNKVGGNSNGIDAKYGAGGSGASSVSNPSSGFSGGLGGDGLTQFWEYA